MNEKFYLMSFMLMDIYVKVQSGAPDHLIQRDIGLAMDLVDRVYEAGKERKWVLSLEIQPPNALME